MANHSFPGSTATQRTQPKWPDMTLKSFHGACHLGLGMVGVLRGKMAPAGGAGDGEGEGPLYGSIAPSDPRAADSATSAKVN